MGNILAFRDVTAQFGTTHDSRTSAGIFVHVIRGGPRRLRFLPAANGLYYVDARADYNISFPTFDHTPSTAHALVNATTVTENMQFYGFTARQKMGIHRAIQTYRNMNRPGEASFKHTILHRELPGIPCTLEDAKNMFLVYGPNVDALRGRTTRTRAPNAPLLRRVPPPAEVLQAHREVTLCTDFFHVDGLVFLITVARNLRHIRVDPTDSTTMHTDAFPRLKHLCNMYSQQGYFVKEIRGDPAFAPLKQPFADPANGGIDLYTCGPRAHIPEAERAIRSVKERNRITVSGLPFKHYPTLLKRATVTAAARSLCLIPHPDGVSPTFSPCALVDGHHPTFDSHCKVAVGSYCELHRILEPTNTETPRTVPGIALGPTSDYDGTYEFMSLNSGRKVTCRDFNELPITADVVDLVHKFATAPPTAVPDPFLFEWSPDDPLDDVPLPQAALGPDEGAPANDNNGANENENTNDDNNNESENTNDDNNNANANENANENENTNDDNNNDNDNDYNNDDTNNGDNDNNNDDNNDNNMDETDDEPDDADANNNNNEPVPN